MNPSEHSFACLNELVECKKRGEVENLRSISLAWKPAVPRVNCCCIQARDNSVGGTVNALIEVQTGHTEREGAGQRVSEREK